MSEKRNNLRTYIFDKFSIFYAFIDNKTIDRDNILEATTGILMYDIFQ